MSRMTCFSIFSGSSDLLIRSFRLLLMSVASRPKKPMASSPLSGGGANVLAQLRVVVRHRDDEVVERAGELVEVHVLEPQRRGDDDVVLRDAVRPVHHVFRVE